MRDLKGILYNRNSVPYGLKPVPMVTPRPAIEFTFEDNGTTEGKQTIKRFKEELPGAMKSISLLYQEAMEKNGIKGPYWARFKLKFAVEATNLDYSSRGKTAAVLYETSNPLKFDLKIDYKGMKNEAIRSNIVHEVAAHPLERLFGEYVTESVTEHRVIDALLRTGDINAAEITKKYSMYV